jgi:hypothetical protein
MVCLSGCAYPCCSSARRSPGALPASVPRRKKLPALLRAGAAGNRRTDTAGRQSCADLGRARPFGLRHLPLRHGGLAAGAHYGTTCYRRVFRPASPKRPGFAKATAKPGIDPCGPRQSYHGQMKGAEQGVAFVKPDARRLKE